MTTPSAQVAAARRQALARDRALARVIQTLMERDRWMRDRLAELAARTRTLELQVAELKGVPPPPPPAPPPPLPQITIPPELRDLIEGGE